MATTGARRAAILISIAASRFTFWIICFQAKRCGQAVLPLTGFWAPMISEASLKNLKKGRVRDGIATTASDCAFIADQGHAKQTQRKIFKLMPG